MKRETPAEYAERRLEQLWSRGTHFLGCRYAILGGAMTWVSEANLVAAISNAGGFGVLASGSMPPEIFRAEIQKTRTKTTKPFGVNLITMNPQLDDLIKICGEEKISHVVLAGGLPTSASIKMLKEYGCKVICFAPAMILAKKLIKSGADALVVEGNEAGGHIGPVTTSVLAQEILPHVKEVPVFVAGGIGRGEAIAQYLEMGASGVQLGTRFVCATECIAHDKFKQAFIKAEARDATPSVQIDPRFPVIPVRGIQNDGTKNFVQAQLDAIKKYESGEMDMKTAQLEIEHFWAGALRRAVVEGDVETGSVMAGQSVGMVKKIEPCADIIHELLEQTLGTLAQQIKA
ncbi:MAG TPA: 2-nitropropane dioxygenase [Rhodospirillaceae bacterium]|nr:2-nitropropane dioxygenase [Rhodospirillaceae bacterium]